MPLAAILLPTGLVAILSTSTGVPLPIWGVYEITLMTVDTDYRTVLD